MALPEPKRIDDPKLLAPQAKQKFDRFWEPASELAKQYGLTLVCFETRRTPERQAYLYGKGRSVALDEAFFARGGAHFSTGIGVSISSTFATLTDDATASEHIVGALYI